MRISFEQLEQRRLMSAVQLINSFVGDANLDGTVNITDFNSLAVNYGTGSLFTSGYDGIVNSLDLNAVATNFGPTPSTPAFLAPNNTVSFITSGDVNEDGIVTPLDFNAIASNFGKHTSSWNEGDVNHDGKVNVKDADIVADHFGQFNAFLVSLNNSSHISS